MSERKRQTRAAPATVARYIEALKAAGVEVAQVDVRADGSFVLIAPSANAAPVSPLEAWKAAREAR